MSVYNIVWADDEIDDLLDEITIQELKENGFNIVGQAHDGHELEALLERPDLVDAVIVDANFNESNSKIESERDTSGLDYARSLYRMTLKCRVPFFLLTNRSDELLKEIYQHNRAFLEDFPRHKRWFKKSDITEYNAMFDEIKKAVEETKSTSFIIRNKYKYELNAASLLDGTNEFIYEFLVRDFENTLDEIKEPFVSVRRSIEKIFGRCENMKLIPPISSNTNGTANYFLHNNYSIKEGETFMTLYEMEGDDIMPKPLAQALKYIVDITQDGSHSKNEMKLKVDEYFEKTKDVLLLRSVVFVLIDVVKWFAVTLLNHNNPYKNERILWKNGKE